MEPVTLATGAVIGYGVSKLVGGKKRSATTKKRSTAKRRKAVTKKATSRKKSSSSAGINKTTGRLKKGYRYGASGRVVKAKSKK